MKKNKVLFVCEPGIGILENIIPLCKKLKQESIIFDIIFLKSSVIKQVHGQPFLKNESMKIFDSYLFLNNGSLYEINDFNKMENLLEAKIFKILRSFLSLLPLRIYFRVNNYMKKISNFFSYPLIKKFRVDITSKIKEYDLVFYDVEKEEIFTETEKSINFFFKIIKNIPKLSFYHSSAFNYVSQKKKISEKLDIQKLHICKFSKTIQEQNLYEYYADNSKIYNLGNPKHDTIWTNYVLANEKKSDFIDENTVYFISRSLTAAYYNMSDKIFTLKILAKLILNYPELKLAIKLHPKEDSIIGKKLYFKYLGKKNYNKTWSFTNVYPLVAGYQCKFAVTVYSGLAIDMLLVQKPVIELVNLNKTSLSEHEYFIDKNNNKISGLNFYNLVYGALDEKQFFEKVRYILNNYDESRNYLYQNYIKCFNTGAIIQNIASKVQEILRK